MGDKSECVKVAVRCRPMSSREQDTGHRSIVDINEREARIRIERPEEAGGSAGEQAKPFTFDFVYGPQSEQRTVFEQCARPLVDNVLEGYNGTMFAYGQTGTGKTFTMEGVPSDENLRGIMPNSFVHIFDAVENSGEHMKYLVRASFLEIYNDNVFDLLNSKARPKMQVKEDPDKGVFVKDLSQYVVKSVPELMKVLARGQKMRKVGETKMNAGSSRSHSLLTITIEGSETMSASEEPTYRVGKLNLVDLAGSERQKKTEASGDRLSEAKSINLSLSALGNVIKALVNPKAKHIPFRDSKLTRLLQDSLGGNTKTVMIAAIGPSHTSFDETMSTLRYANRAKNIKNKPKINEDPKDAMLRQFQEEINLLKAQLEAKRKGMSMADYMAQFGANLNVGGGAAGEREVEEKIVEKLVYEDTGISEADLKAKERMTEAELARWEADRQAQRRALTDDTERLELEAKEKERLLKKKDEAIARELEKLESMQRKIEERESQIQQGAVQRDEAIRMKAELKRTEAELAERKAEEERLKEQLAVAEESDLYMNEHCATTEQLLVKTTAKLKSMWTKYGDKKQELDGLQEEFELEREDLIDSMRALDRKMKLKQLVLDNFAPPHYVEMIEERAMWSEYQDAWHLPGLEYACNNVARLMEDVTHDDGHYYRKEADDEYGRMMWEHQQQAIAAQEQARRNGTLDMEEDYARDEYFSNVASNQRGLHDGVMSDEMQEALHRAMTGGAGGEALADNKDVFYSYGGDAGGGDGGGGDGGDFSDSGGGGGKERKRRKSKSSKRDRRDRQQQYDDDDDGDDQI